MSPRLGNARAPRHAWLTALTGSARLSNPHLMWAGGLPSKGSHAPPTLCHPPRGSLGLGARHPGPCGVLSRLRNVSHPDHGWHMASPDPSQAGITGPACLAMWYGLPLAQFLIADLEARGEQGPPFSEVVGPTSLTLLTVLVHQILGFDTRLIIHVFRPAPHGWGTPILRC